jgi:murein L,D-transpeptidase YcbB/YkuD
MGQSSRYVASIKLLQRKINQRFAEFSAIAPFVKVNGSFSTSLTAAVKYFQCAAFLPVTGIVDLVTWDFLLTGVDSLPILGPGSYGAMVWEIQIMLQHSGFPVRVSGVFSRSLVQQIKQYQALQGVKDNGVIDSATWAVLVQERMQLSRCYAWLHRLDAG